MTCIALLRGINVGKAKRLPMADLRKLLEGLDLTNVRTLLNSGNAVFEADRPSVAKLAAAIEKAIEAKFGFTSRTVVVTAKQIDDIIEEAPLLSKAPDPARHLVAFAVSPAALTQAKALKKQVWKPDAIEVTSRAAYLWCETGIIESKLMKAFAKATGDTMTARNWATVLKLQAMALSDRA